MIIQSPHNIAGYQHLFKVFVAGSIEMGVAQPWQSQVEQAFQNNNDILLLNPRRNDWDASWQPDISNEQFNTQVTWELNHLEAADLIIVYFDPATKSPITMLELGLFARSGKLVVCCPQGFWRKGNIDIVCKKYSIEQVADIEMLIESIKQKIAINNHI